MSSVPGGATLYSQQGTDVARLLARVNQTVHNGTGATLARGTPVYISGFHETGGIPIVSPADAADAATFPLLGCAAEPILPAANGEVAVGGEVAGVDTSAWALNAELYVAVGGGLTDILPSSPALQVKVAIVTKVGGPGEGRIVVYPTPVQPSESGVPAGGSAGQALLKSGPLDLDTVWSDLHDITFLADAAATVTVDVANLAVPFVTYRATAGSFTAPRTITFIGTPRQGQMIRVVHIGGADFTWTVAGLSGGNVTRILRNNRYIEIGVGAAGTLEEIAGGPVGHIAINGLGIPAGGTLGQILAKTGSNDFELGWVDATSGGTVAPHTHPLGEITGAGTLAALNEIGVNNLTADLQTRVLPDPGALPDGRIPVTTGGGWGTGELGNVTAVFGRTGNVLAQAGDYSALQITFAPAGNLAGVTVQAVLEELDAEKAPAVHTHTLSQVTDAGALAAKTKVTIADIDAPGTPDGTTALFGDGWKVPATGGASDYGQRTFAGTINPDASVTYETFAQSGPQSFAKGDGTSNGAVHILPFVANDAGNGRSSPLSWGPGFVAAHTLTAVGLPTDLPAGEPTSLFFSYHAQRNEILVSWPNLLDVDLPAHTHGANDVIPGHVARPDTGGTITIDPAALGARRINFWETLTGHLTVNLATAGQIDGAELTLVRDGQDNGFTSQLGSGVQGGPSPFPSGWTRELYFSAAEAIWKPSLYGRTNDDSYPGSNVGGSAPADSVFEITGTGYTLNAAHRDSQNVQLVVRNNTGSGAQACDIAIPISLPVGRWELHVREALAVRVMPPSAGTLNGGTSPVPLPTVGGSSNGATVRIKCIANPGGTAPVVVVEDETAEKVVLPGELDLNGQTVSGAATFTGPITANNLTLGGALSANGRVISGNLAGTGTASGTLTAAAHSGRVLRTTGNIVVPNTLGFNCTLIFGGAHTVAFGATVSPAMAAGDMMSLVVADNGTIHAVRTPAADKVAFS